LNLKLRYISFAKPPIECIVYAHIIMYQCGTDYSLVSSPDPPSTLQEERVVWWIQYNILVPPRNFGSTIWLADVAIISPVLGFLTSNHLALLITPFRPTLHTLQFTEAQEETSKAWL